MKVAVTGVSGHVGYVTHLLLKQHNIQRRYLLREPVEYIQNEDCVIGNLATEDALEQLVKDCTTVIHIAGIVWPSFKKNKNVFDVNYQGTKKLFEIARKNGAKHFIYISSIHAFQESKSEVLDESTPLCENSNIPYNFSKAESERFLNQQKDVKITILNPTAIIGAGDFYINGMNQIFKKIEQNKLPMVVEGGYNVVDVKDVANAIINAVRQQKEGKYLIAGNYITMYELAQLYGKINQLKVTKRVLGKTAMRTLAKLASPFEAFTKKPISLNTYAVDTLLHGHQNISNKKAEKALGFSVRPIEQTLRDIHCWLNKKEISV